MAAKTKKNWKITKNIGVPVNEKRENTIKKSLRYLGSEVFNQLAQFKRHLQISNFKSFYNISGISFIFGAYKSNRSAFVARPAGSSNPMNIVL